MHGKSVIIVETVKRKDTRPMTVYEQMHSGRLYNPGDDDLMKEQFRYLDMLHEFNTLRPTEFEKREAMLPAKSIILQRDYIAVKTLDFVILFDKSIPSVAHILYCKLMRVGTCLFNRFLAEIFFTAKPTPLWDLPPITKPAKMIWLKMRLLDFLT